MWCTVWDGREITSGGHPNSITIQDTAAIRAVELVWPWADMKIGPNGNTQLDPNRHVHSAPEPTMPVPFTVAAIT